MKKRKLTLLALSLLVTVLAIGCTARKTESNEETNRNEVSMNESVNESKPKRKTSNEDEDTNNTGAESSITNPLVIKETAITSKKVNDIYKNVSVTLTNVYRGDDAKSIVRTYNDNHDLSKYADLKSDILEYVILEYETTFPNDIDGLNNGLSSDMDIEITGLDDNQIKNGKMNYIITTSTLKNTEDLYAGDTGITRVIFTFPTDIKEFVVKIGDNKDNMAYFLVK